MMDFDTKILILVNRKLYDKKIIDENTYYVVNDILLKKLSDYN